MFRILTVIFVAAASAAAWLPVAQAQSDSDSEPTSELRTYDNWSVRCVRPEDGEKACSLFQRVALQDGRQLLLVRLEKNVVRQEEELPVDIAVVTTPLGVYLPTGVTVQVDDLEPTNIEYEHCDQGGCYAGVVLEEVLKASLKAGTNCKVSFHNLSGKKLTATLSLDGFSAGYESF